jgi:hypothetical protein
MEEELKKYKADLAAWLAEKEKLAEELKQVRFECYKLKLANEKLTIEKAQAQAETKAANQAATKAGKEQDRLLGIVKGLCTLTPNPLSTKQLVIQNKTLKLKLTDADFRVRQMYLNYESLEKRHDDLLFSRYQEREHLHLSQQLRWLEEKYNSLKADYYRLKNDLAL